MGKSGFFCDRTVTDKLSYTCKNAVEMERNLKFIVDNIYMLRNDVYVKGTIRWFYFTCEER